jgi:hypothetical protein
MKKKLSSDLTQFYKYSWIFFIIIFCVFLVMSDAPVDGKVIFCFFFVFGVFIIWVLYGSLKTVETDSNSLYVSDGRYQVIIPHMMIQDVYQSWLSREPIIVIKFKVATKFGERIEFIPYRVFRLPFSQHPVVDELKRIACLSSN